MSNQKLLKDAKCQTEICRRLVNKKYFQTWQDKRQTLVLHHERNQCVSQQAERAKLKTSTLLMKILHSYSSCGYRSIDRQKHAADEWAQLPLIVLYITGLRRLHTSCIPLDSNYGHVGIFTIWSDRDLHQDKMSFKAAAEDLSQDCRGYFRFSSFHKVNSDISSFHISSL